VPDGELVTFTSTQSKLKSIGENQSPWKSPS